MAVEPRNPFKPTAGMNPPELIGRNGVIAAFAESLDNGPGAPDRLMRISGIRGIGKTVLLNALGEVAASQGFRVVNVASDEGFCERIVRMLADSRAPQSMVFEPELFGMKVGSVEFTKTSLDFTETLWGASQNGGLFITVDEVQDASPEEMRRFGNDIQLLVRRGANIAFAFAGLPSAVDRVVNGRGLTFLQRAKQVSLARLERYQVQDSLEMTVRSSGMEIDSEVAAYLAQAAAGYPYMVQLVGYHAWQAAVRRGAAVIGGEDAERAVTRARCDFDAMVIEPALRRLPAGQIEYLVAMAQCEGAWVSSGEVAQAMGRETKDVSTFRKRLIDASLVESPGYGRVGFSIPYMREYLVRNASSLQEELEARW